MCLVDGQTLDSIWDSYSEPTKAAIASQLKSYMDEIRNLGNGSYISSVDHGSATTQILSIIILKVGGRSPDLTRCLACLQQALIYRKRNSTKQSLPPMKRISQTSYQNLTRCNAFSKQASHRVYPG